MQPARRHIFYGDLNCPFCFVQSVRIERSGRSSLVEWRGVVHMPKLGAPAHKNLPEPELAEEVRRVRERAPDVEIQLPKGRPDSRAATMAIAQAHGLGPAVAHRLRSLFHEALWGHGEDISDPALIKRLAKEAGVVGPLSGSAGAERMRTWQQEWESPEYDRRLPSMRSAHGNVVLGMQPSEKLTDFLWVPFEGDTDDACRG